MEQRNKKWSIKNFFKKKKVNINEEKIEIQKVILASSPYDIKVKKVQVKKIEIRK